MVDKEHADIPVHLDILLQVPKQESKQINKTLFETTIEFTED